MTEYTDHTEHTPPLLAAFYGRVSGPNDESIDNQLKIAREVAAGEGFIIPDSPGFSYQDVHVSGTKVSRGGFDRMIKDVTEGAARFTRVYVRERARFGRWKDPRRHNYFEVLLADKGVEVRYCDREYVPYSEGVDSAAMGGFMFDSVDSVRASVDHTELSRKMVARKRELALDAFRAGGPVPYGFDLVLVERRSRRVVRRLDPGERTQKHGCHLSLRTAEDRRLAAIRFMFDGVEQGLSLRRITRELNDGMFPPPSRNGIWQISTVSDMLRNPVYMGTLTHAGGRLLNPLEPAPHATVTGEEPIVVHDAFPDPPISREQFARVKGILAGVRTSWTKRRATKPKYLFTGKMVCTACGYSYQGMRRPDRSGRIVYRHSRSEGNASQTCPSRYLYTRCESLEDLVLGHIRALLTHPTLETNVQAELKARIDPQHPAGVDDEIEKTTKWIKDREKQIRLLTDDLKRVTAETARNILLADIQAMGTETDGAKHRLKNLRGQQQLLAEKLQMKSPLLTDAEELVRWIDSGDYALRRALVERIVESIHVHEGARVIDIIITYI